MSFGKEELNNFLRRKLMYNLKTLHKNEFSPQANKCFWKSSLNIALGIGNETTS